MKVYLMLDENRRIKGYSTLPSDGDDFETDLPPDSEILQKHGLYIVTEEGQFIKDDSFLLNEVRERKMNELSARCREEILGYFEAPVNSVPYLFSFDAEAQSNFIGTLALFTKGMITEMDWTVHRDGLAERITLDENQFLQVVAVAFANKDKQINKLRKDLQTKVYSETDIEVIESITWNEGEEPNEALYLEPFNLY